MNNLIKRVSTAEAVVNYIRDQIVTGKLKPGDTLPSERELVAQFGISRFSLREGLARLDALGIIEIQHGRGSVVSRELSKRSLSDVFLPLVNNEQFSLYANLIESRIVVEKATSAKAALVRSQDDLGQLSEIVALAEKELHHPEKFGEIDANFHLFIASIAGNSFLQEMLEMLHSYIRSFILENVKDLSTREIALADHHEILRYIELGDAERVSEFMETHILKCKSQFDDHH